MQSVYGDGQPAGIPRDTVRRPPGAEGVARHYDVLDRHYREIWGEHVHHGLWLDPRDLPERATRQLVELAAGLAGVRAGSRVCDVGCGYGATARLLVDELGAQVTGITVSLAQLRYGQARARGENPRLVLGDWLDNGLPSESFDAVLAIESVSHMHERPRVFAECLRVLRPGGRLVVLDWLAAEATRRWQRRLLLDPICRAGHLPRLDSLRQYGEMLQRAGFEGVTGRDLSAQVWRTWPWVLRLGGRRMVSDAQLRRLVVDPRHEEREFLGLIAYLMAGYATRSFRYGLLSARRGAV